jgi:uncharacterized membrane protein
MKKHIDWKRIGWTALITGGLSGLTYLTSWIRSLYDPSYGWTFGEWLVSFTLMFLCLSLFVIVVIVFWRISIFFYHNGETKE